MFISTIKGTVTEKSITDSDGKVYHNVFIRQNGSRSDVRVTVKKEEYDSLSVGKDTDLHIKCYANVSRKGEAYNSLATV